MNEKLLKGNSAYDNGFKEPQEVMRLLMDHMVELRPRKDVTLKAYFKQPMFMQKSVSGAVKLDMNAGFADAKEGDVAYAASWLLSDQQAEAAMTIRGNATVWLNGECVYDKQDWTEDLDKPGWEGRTTIPIQLLKDKNELLIRCAKQEKSWGILLWVSCPRYPHIWTRDYLLNTRCTLPSPELEELEGAAFLGPFPKDVAPQGPITIDYANGMECNNTHYAWTPTWEERETLHNTDTPGSDNSSAGCTYALTYCDTLPDHDYILEFTYMGACKVFVDNQPVYVSDADCHTLTIPGNGSTREILVKCVSHLDKWNFTGKIYEKSQPQHAVNHLAFIKTGGNSTAPWICVGPFKELPNAGIQQLLDTPFAPEKEIQFTRPYALGDYNQAFWRLPQKEVYIRPYQDSIFFGQWFYAVQVGLYGLFIASRALKDREMTRYFLDSIQVMADHYDYAVWDQKQFGDSTMIPRACDLRALDPCGTIGVSMIESYLHTGDEMLLRVIRMLGDNVMDRIPRLDDNTFYRIHTMWADDFYMSCPFLARMYRLTGEKKYADRVAAQIDGFYKRLYMPDQKLFSHIFFPDKNCPNRVPWGRGNGWIAVTLTELLQYLQGEPCWEKALAIYKDFMEGIAAVQDEDGMWHQVLNLPETYKETSCTGMFLLSMLRGIKNGWLDADQYQDVTHKAWNALLKNSIDKDGNVYGVCMGSGCSMDPAYYGDIPTHINDDHGTGILLMAVAEMIEKG